MPTQHSEQPQHDSSIDADQMAAQTIHYMDIFADHVVHIRGCQDVGRRLVDEGQLLPANSPWPSSHDHAGDESLRSRMEAIIRAPATTVEESVMSVFLT